MKCAHTKKAGAYRVSFCQPRRRERVIFVDLVIPIGATPASLYYDEADAVQAKADYDALESHGDVVQLLAAFGFDEHGACLRAAGC